MSPAEIAEKLGCSLSTLRVRCSEAGISLKRPYGRVGIPRDAINAARDRAAMMGTSEAALMMSLIGKAAFGRPHIRARRARCA